MSTELAQQQLQDALTTTFLANLAFFNEYDNNLYQRIDRLSQLINKGEFEENYVLEFIMDDGDFDIYDIQNDCYLYDKKPNKFNRNAYAKTDFTSKGSVSILDQQLFQGLKFQTFDEVEYFCNFDYANELLANDIAKYVDILKNNIGDYKFKKYKYINKFIFVGTLLGRHIPLILEKTQAKNFFVCEENLELFRLSLFVVDYSVLARNGNTAVFSIMDDSHTFDEQMEKFLSHKAYENYNIKYYTTDYNISTYFDQIMNAVLAHKSTSFNYHMMLGNMVKSAMSRVNKYKTLQIQKSMDSSCLDVPILFLGAGPSLGDNIEWVKKNQHKFIIVAMGATYKRLLKYGIRPHLVTTLDPQFSVLNTKHFDITNVKKLDNTYIFAAMNTDQRILDRLNQDKLYLFEMLKPLHSSNVCYKGFSVGEISAAILLGLGFKNLYFLGIDFALNQQTGDSHVAGYKLNNYGGNLKDKKQREYNNSFSFDEELIEVEGNLQKSVFTTRLFTMSLNAMSTNINLTKKPFQKVYNLSNHGALISGTIPAEANDTLCGNYQDMKYEQLEKMLGDFLSSISSNRLSEQDQNDLLKELAYLETALIKINELKMNTSESFDDFRIKVDNLIELLLFPHVYCSLVHAVFIHFINVTMQYVYYVFNDQKLVDEEEKIVKIEKVFFEQSEKLLSKYINYLKQA